MNYRFAVSIPAPGLVEIARQAVEHGLTVTVVSSDPDYQDGVIFSVQHERNEKEEAQELEDLADQAWEGYYED
jgi:hypothetical protein